MAKNDDLNLKAVISEYFSFTAIIVIAAFCYTIGYFELYRIPEAPGLDTALAFYLRSVLSSIFHLNWTDLIHVPLIIFAFVIPHWLAPKQSLYKLMGIIPFTALMAFVSYELGADYFEVREFASAHYTIEPSGANMSAETVNRYWVYASESGIFYWLVCKSQDSQKSTLDELYVEGMNGGNSSYYKRIDSDRLGRFCK